MRLLMVANREPLRETSEGWAPSVGGLTTALLPVLQERGGVWVAWGEKQAKEQPQVHYPPDDPRFTVRRLYLTKQELARYYYGFANRTLWPLCHYFIEEMELREDFFRAYQTINRRFAKEALDAYEEGDLVWVQDYQLMLVPELFRREKPASRIGFFFHIPFPAPEVWRVLPYAKKLTDGLLGADLIGFHNEEYAKNFLEAAELTGAQVEGNRIHWQGREVAVEVHPIGIDTAHFQTLSEEAGVKAEVRRLRNEARSDFVLVGVDRLDYTKGILERLLAFECFLETYPEYRERVTLYQVAAPSRTRVQSYLDLKRKVDEAVGRINGDFMRGSWVPVRYLYRSLPPERLVPMYLAADAALVTPLRDGMNLVAQEFVWTSKRGILILSELTGASGYLKEALSVHPHNTAGMAEQIHAALSMPEEERQERMTKMKERIAEMDVHKWAGKFLTALEQ